MANMFSGKDAVDPSYPTQWALNPNAYQNVDSSMVDWAALAQQWIAMKDAAAIMSTTSAPSSKPDVEEGEAPMEVENPDASSESVPPPGAEWNASTNSWGTPGWNQWGWGWGPGGVDPKMSSDSSMTMAPLIDGYTVPSDGTAPIPGYTTGATPTFQHGYWTAPQNDQQANSRDSSRSRERRSKSKNRDHKPSRSRTQRDKLPILPPVIEPIIAPTLPATTLDAAKRRQLPAWIREGLEKMEREKQRAIEREQEKKAREEAELEKKKLEELELERLKAEAGGQPMLPAKSKFESDSEGSADEAGKAGSPPPAPPAPASPAPSPAPTRTKDEILQEVMFTVRRSLTEILLEVTDSEIHTVSQEELARYTATQGLGAYESSSEESDAEDEQTDISDQQLQEIIRRKKQEFERTSRQIEAEVDSDRPTTPDTPDHRRSSATPPPVDDTPEKIPERRSSKEKRNHKSNDKIDGLRRLESIPEEKPKKSSKKDLTPSPQKNNHKKESSSSTSDSEADSPTSLSESESEREVKHETKSKKRKRRSSSSSDSQKKSKKHKKEKSRKSGEKRSSKTSHRDVYDKEKSRSKKRDDYHDRHKSSRSRDYERSHKDKYRDDSEDERPRKRSKRSRSLSYDSRRRSAARSERSRERERERERDRHDRYERSRDDRRRSRSRSRHRR